MKKIIGLTALSMGLMLTSCSDFLDQKSPSDMDKENIFNSAYLTGLEINKIYGDFGLDDMYTNRMTISYGANTDTEIIDGLGSTSTASNERGYMNYNGTAGGWDKLGNTWTDIYSCIEYCNQAIDGIRKGSASNETTMKRYLGEALTLRAMLYLDLVRLWGDVPFKTEPAKDDLSNAYVGKTDRDEILDALLVDLDEASTLLPWAGTGSYTTEHTTKGYADALYAQVALTRAGYAIRESAKEGYETLPEFSDPTYPTQRPDAATRKVYYEKALVKLTEIINSGVHSMNPSFRNEWQLLCARQLDQTYRENIFEIPMLLNSTSELGYTVGKRIGGSTTEFGQKGNSTGKLSTTATLLYSYEKADTRRAVTCCPVKYTENKAENKTVECMVGTKDGSSFNAEKQSVKPFSISIGKWRPEWMGEDWKTTAINKGNNKTDTGINVVKMRFSQVLLMYAEVMNELAGANGNYQGDAGMTALQALAMVHNRGVKESNNDTSIDGDFLQAAANHNKEQFLNDIAQENAWELTGENARKWDLVRWGMLASKIAEAKAEYAENCLNWPEKIYFKYTDASKTRIDENSILYYGLEEAGKSESDYDATEQATAFGFKNEEARDQSTTYTTDLPSISSGLVGTSINGKPVAPTHGILNRYILPIYTKTIADSRSIANSYGF